MSSESKSKSQEIPETKQVSTVSSTDTKAAASTNDLKAYDALKKRYNLPEFSAIEKNFDLFDIDNTRILSDIRDKIQDRFDEFSKLVETLFQPEGDFSSFIETKCFEDELKDDYYDAYKKIRYIIRESQLMMIYNEEEKDAKFIIESHKVFSEIRPVLIDLLERLKSCWKTTTVNDSVKYFG